MIDLHETPDWAAFAGPVGKVFSLAAGKTKLLAGRW